MRNGLCDWKTRPSFPITRKEITQDRWDEMFGKKDSVVEMCASGDGRVAVHFASDYNKIGWPGPLCNNCYVNIIRKYATKIS